MARYKEIDLSPRFLAVDLEQLLSGSFAHAVHHLLLARFACNPRPDWLNATCKVAGQ